MESQTTDREMDSPVDNQQEVDEGSPGDASPVGKPCGARSIRSAERPGVGKGIETKKDVAVEQEQQNPKKKASCSPKYVCFPGSANGMGYLAACKCVGINRSCQERNRELEDKLKRLKSEKDDALRRYQEQGSDVESYQEHITDLEQSAEDKGNDLLSSQQRVCTLEARITQLEKEKNDAQNSSQQRVRALEARITQLEKEKNDALSSSQQRVRSLEARITQLKKEKNDALSSSQQRVRALEARITQLEKEKNDALSRLSEQISTKLRDNNPNIVDLSDPCRPIKLGEMFSELYDNEWTDAFSVMESKYSAKQAISFLLDIVMVAYYFCKNREERLWQIVSKHFLCEDPDSARYSTPRKTLKDARRARLLKTFEELAEDFVTRVQEKCSKDIQPFVQKKEMIKYLRSCARLCGLMRTCDPPVVLDCPGWIPIKERKRTNTQIVVDATDKDMSINVEEGDENIDMDWARGTVDTTNKDTASALSNSDTVDRVNTETYDDAPSIAPLGERPRFDTDHFRSYIRSGSYNEYFVWPVMLLHEGSRAVLVKGVAQGTNEWNEHEDGHDESSLWK